MTTHTAVIVPAQTDIAGQCRIVARYGTIRKALTDYRKNPDLWHDVGIINSRGELVCCDPHGNLIEELKACVPFTAGLQLHFTAPEAEL